MLNIQVRGFLAKIKVRSISKKQKEFLHTNISNSKTNLTEIVESQFETDFLSVNEIVLPIVTDDAELIVTSFPENDYYSDGYSFFREKLKTLTDKASILEDIKVNNYGLMKKTVYYGCSFEADLKQVDYQNFDKNHLDIETVNIPFLRQDYIKNIFYRNKKINDTKRLKNQLVRQKAILYKNSKIKKSDFDIVTYSENDIDRSNEAS